MTQDQAGQAQGTGYVVRGEVVPDDETEATETEQSGHMTRFQKVASALRGDRPNQTAGEPNGVDDEEYADATGPNEVSAVRSPDAGNGDYWDNGQDVDATVPDETRADENGALDPSMTGPDTYTATTPTPAVPAAGYASQADTRAGYVSPADTEAEYSSQAGTIPGPEGPANAAPPVTETAATGTATTGTATTGAVSEAATAEGGPAGKHAAGAADAGLRPGEATDRLGDFGDIAFGNLLPDAEQYTARWQQIQFRFVDDPQASVTEAADVVSQVTAKLEAAIQERQRAIEERQRAIQERAGALRGRWGEGSNADTETLRETLRMYRKFMDQLIGTTS
jgi:hypothetical protein